MKQWPRLLYCKEAPEGLLCTSDAHRAMLGPTWFEMPAALEVEKKAPALNVAEDYDPFGPETMTPALPKARKGRGRA